MVISHNTVNAFDIYRRDFMAMGILNCVQITHILKKNIYNVKPYLFFSLSMYEPENIIEIRNKNNDWFFDFFKKDDLKIHSSNNEWKNSSYDILTNQAMSIMALYIAGF